MIVHTPACEADGATASFKKAFVATAAVAPQRRSTASIIRKMLQSTIAVTVDGKHTKVTVVEAMAARVRNEALGGSLRALERGLAIAEKYSLKEITERKDQYDWNRISMEELDELYRLVDLITIEPGKSAKKS